MDFLNPYGRKKKNPLDPEQAMPMQPTPEPELGMDEDKKPRPPLSPSQKFAHRQAQAKYERLKKLLGK